MPSSIWATSGSCPPSWDAPAPASSRTHPPDRRCRRAAGLVRLDQLADFNRAASGPGSRKLQRLLDRRDLDDGEPADVLLGLHEGTVDDEAIGSLVAHRLGSAGRLELLATHERAGRGMARPPVTDLRVHVLCISGRHGIERRLISGEQQHVSHRAIPGLTVRESYCRATATWG